MGRGTKVINLVYKSGAYSIYVIGHSDFNLCNRNRMMGHGAGKNSEVSNLPSLTPCPAARSKPPPQPAARHATSLRQRAAATMAAAAHGCTGTAHRLQPWRSWTDLVATLALNRFRRAAALPSVPGSIDLGARLGFGRGDWQCQQMRVLTAEEPRTATQIRRRGQG